MNHKKDCRCSKCLEAARDMIAAGFGERFMEHEARRIMHYFEQRRISSGMDAACLAADRLERNILATQMVERLNAAP